MKETPLWQIINDATDTADLVSGPCRLGKLIVYTVGTSGDIKIYDDQSSGTDNLLYHWVTADGKAVIDFGGIRLTEGIKVVVTNDPVAVVTYDS